MTTDPVPDDSAIRSTDVTRLPAADFVFTTVVLPSGARAYRLPPLPAPVPPPHIPSFLDSDDDDLAAIALSATPVPTTPSPAAPSPAPPSPPPAADLSLAAAPLPAPPAVAPVARADDVKHLVDRRDASHLPPSHLPASHAPASHLPASHAPVSPAPAWHVSAAPTPGPAGSGLYAEGLPGGAAISAEIAVEPPAQPTTPATTTEPATATQPGTATEPATATEPGTLTQPGTRRPEVGEWRGIVVVTGTDTDVGKTIVTAAIAAAAQASGLRVAVIKPGQTGTATGAPTDIDVVNRLAAPDTVRTLAEYPEPMAPLAAATIAELPPLELYEVVDAIRIEADKHDLVLVEGAGGLLVQMGVRPSGAPWTVADLATTLGVGTLVVARAGLGTLNHTALTLEALNRRGVPAGVIIGAWPADPELVHWSNLSELVPYLVGALPEGAGRMDPGVFRRSAPGWLTPALYGVLDNWRVWAEEAG